MPLNNNQKRQIDLLWKAATDYEQSRISGSAPAMLVAGVLQNKPKCMAVSTWMQTIWTLYYQRRAAVIAMTFDGSYDFSTCGDIPYSVPELMAEVFE